MGGDTLRQFIMAFFAANSGLTGVESLPSPRYCTLDMVVWSQLWDFNAVFLNQFIDKNNFISKKFRIGSIFIQIYILMQIYNQI